MESPNFKGRDMEEVYSDPEICSACQNPKPPVLIGYRDLGGARYDLKGVLVVPPEPTPVPTVGAAVAAMGGVGAGLIGDVDKSKSRKGRKGKKVVLTGVLTGDDPPKMGADLSNLGKTEVKVDQAVDANKVEQAKKTRKAKPKDKYKWTPSHKSLTRSTKAK